MELLDHKKEICSAVTDMNQAARNILVPVLRISTYVILWGNIYLEVKLLNRKETVYYTYLGLPLYLNL